MEDFVKDIDNIMFGIYSPEEIRRISVCEINNQKLKGPNTVYDERLGADPISGEKCKTCEKSIEWCPGHFGHIELNVEILHPLYFKIIFSLLKCVCTKCHRLLMTKEHIELHNLNNIKGEKRFQAIQEKMNGFCGHCGTLHPKIVLNTKEGIFIKTHKNNKEMISVNMETEDIKEILFGIPDEDVVLMGFNPEMVRPRNYILSVLPVIPTCARPIVMTDGDIHDDDLTTQMCEIIKVNNVLGNPELKETERQKALSTIKFRIQTLFDNSKNKACHTSNNRPMKGLKERISGKGGQIRSNLLGKRSDQTARTVIGPDPTLKIDEVGIPRHIAKTLTYPEIVNNRNIKQLFDMIKKKKANFVVNNNKAKINLDYAIFVLNLKLKNGDIILRNKRQISYSENSNTELEKGDIIKRGGKTVYILTIGNIVHRQLRDGDYVMFGRQPTLHKGGLMGFRARVLPGKTLRLNLSVCKSFNSDFDGDEMNLYSVQSIEAAVELKELASVKKNIISPQSSQCNITIVQDSLLGVYKMTKGIQKVRKDQFFQIANFLEPSFILKRSAEIRKVYKELGLKASAFNGRGLFSLLLPKDFHMEIKNDAYEKEPIVKIYKGVMYEGAINKTNLGGNNKSIILLLHKEYGIDVACEFVDHIQFMTNNYLSITGFSIGISDCMSTSKKSDNFIEKEIEIILQKCYTESEELEKTISHKGIREIKILTSLNNARDIGLRIAKDGMGDDNGFKATTVSGSKGDMMNIAQISGLLGQQIVKGKRIPYGLNHGQRSHPSYILGKELPVELKYESKGFIRHSFLHGLTPREYFFHAMSGREGMINTALGTARSGYIHRKISKLLEDTQVHYDNTVRNVAGNIYQVTYGNNGFDPSKTVLVKGKYKFCDISRLVKKLNVEKEKKEIEESDEELEEE